MEFLAPLAQSYETVSNKTSIGIGLVLGKRASSSSVSSSSASLEGGDISGSVSSTFVTHFTHLALSGSLRWVLAKSSSPLCFPQIQQVSSEIWPGVQVLQVTWMLREAGRSNDQ